MSAAPGDAVAFRDYEAAGWEMAGEAYHRFFGPITDRVAEGLLDAAHVRNGTRTLDVATGPGYVAARAAARGAAVIGVDIAHQVLALAARLHPAVEFRQADAEQLPFDDGTFDAVVGNFALLHMGQPERAAAEWTRVLRAGGHLALTMWGEPAESRVLGVIVDALQAAGALPPADIPPGPPVFRYAADEALAGLLRGLGLQGVAVRQIAFPHRLGSPDELWDGVLAGTVRTSATITRQPPETQRRIRAAFDRLVGEYATDDGVVLPIMVKLAAGQKPGQTEGDR